MAIQSVTLKNGEADYPITFEDNVTWGELRLVIRESMELDLGKETFKLNPEIFASHMAMRALRTPANIKSQREFDKLPAKLAMSIMKTIGKVYPVTGFLEEAATMIYGVELEDRSQTSKTNSTDST